MTGEHTEVKKGDDDDVQHAMTYRGRRKAYDKPEVEYVGWCASALLAGGGALYELLHQSGLMI